MATKFVGDQLRGCKENQIYIRTRSIFNVFIMWQPQGLLMNARN